MASALVVPNLTDTPASYADLKKKCEYSVEEMAQVVRQIGESQNNIYTYQGQLNRGELINPDEIVDAQRFVEETKAYLDGSLWAAVNRLVQAIPQHFTNIIEWLRAQNQVLDNTSNEWKKQKLYFLQGGPSDCLKSPYENLSTTIANIEGVALVLQNQLERYMLVIDDLIGVNRNSEEHVSSCQAIITDCRHRVIEARKHLTELVQRSMIVFEEPPKIIRKGTENANKKKGTKITIEMEIRFLAGEKLGLLRENLELDVAIISEQQAEDIVEKKINPCRDPLFPVGRLSFPKCTLKTSDSDGLVAKVVDARITSVERASDDDASKVMYHLLFRIKNNKRLADNTGETYLQYWAVSLPFSVVINATRQERFKQAQMFWHFGFDIDTMTSLLKRSERVRWPVFFKALDTWFRRSSQPDKQSFVMQRGLEGYEAYFKEKIGLKADNMVTWEMFYRRKIDANSTFWEWFYPIKDYVARYSAYWESGLILGFGSRLTVERHLEGATEPSLVLKFSDSRPGKLVASYVNWDPQRLIEHVIFDEDEDAVFANKSPVECVRLSAKLGCILMILPSKKPIADFYALEAVIAKKETQKNDGYVKPGVVFVWGDKPTAPAFDSQMSPAGSIDNQANFGGSDDGLNQSGEAAPIYGSNYRQFIQSAGSIRQSSSTSSGSAQSPFGLGMAGLYPENTVQSFPMNNIQQNEATAHQPHYAPFPSLHQQPQHQHQQLQYPPQWGQQQPTSVNCMQYVQQELPQRVDHMHLHLQALQVDMDQALDPHQQLQQQQQQQYAHQWGQQQPTAVNYMQSAQQELPQQVQHMHLHQQAPQVDTDQALDQLLELTTDALQNPLFAHDPRQSGTTHF